MARTTDELTDADLAFLEERHLGTLTTLRGDDALPHVVAIAFTFDPETGTASVICSDGTQKVRNVETHGRAVLCQVDGPRWMALEGTARVVRDEAS
ncbi:MAG: pyridoxamine 5'-phosphate oxidase family protein, partial [Acidimicrobiia bacterium]|nr:pyridoxamine 5'-phosphate oxidase family protein [Acidimicrobiia bacterium]